MADDMLRAFERALAAGDTAEVLRLAPGILARARNLPDLPAPERERERVEERKRIGERLLGLASLGLGGTGGVEHDERGSDLGALLFRGELPPDPSDYLLRVTNAEGLRTLEAPLTEVHGGLAGVYAFATSRGIPRLDTVRMEVFAGPDGRRVWARGPTPGQEPIYDRVTIPAPQSWCGRPARWRDGEGACVRPTGHPGPCQCAESMG